MDCSQSVLEHQSETTFLDNIYQVANDSGLFTPTDIKVRVNPYKTCTVGGKQENFVHVFAHIMEGRTTEQKANLSREMVSKLKELLPSVNNIAMNISDFEKATYCNVSML